MDLEYNGRPDLATEFVERYAEFAADPAPAALRHHYTAYRAAVRARVACLRVTQIEEKGVAGDATAEARRYAEIARQQLERAAVRLVLVSGLPGTGKSTVAQRLADECGAAGLSSDRVRKELAGLCPEELASEDYRTGLHAPEATERVYGELLAGPRRCWVVASR